ncbi:MAG: DNA polymerase III subunit [Syntrophomonadaceae bacterium]|jgi:DNA polymerase-3 subunit delta'|nr:DNA polymerase III subunit [Syntrophomonadaceae bacterium]
MNYFSNVAGQEQAVKILSKSLESGMLSHAYIFTGAAGVGKMHTARAFAESIISQSDKDAKMFFKNNMHPDLLIIEKRPEKTVIIKEQITSEMEPWLQLKPFRAARRVVIIRDAHLMRNEVANSLLKTLEEAPRYAIIILVSDENRMLETILSRCQLIRFHSVNEQIIEKLLLNRGVEADKAYRVSQLASGSINAALRYASEENFSDRWEIAQMIVTSLASGQLIEVYLSAEKMELDPDLISSMLETLLRDIYIYKLTNRKELLIIAENIQIMRKLKMVNDIKIKKAINSINNLRELYRTNVNTLSINLNICWEVWEAFQ